MKKLQDKAFRFKSDAIATSDGGKARIEIYLTLK